jgi:hypothetical protein
MTDETPRDDVTETAGGSTDQHVTGSEETGRFLVDTPPTSETPSHGSSNKGINDLKANRQPPTSSR